MYNDNRDVAYQLAYRQAERRVRAKIGFYWHIASYVIINAALVILCLLTGPFAGRAFVPWFIWPMFGWGIGLAFHFLAVFVFVNNDKMRQRMIAQEMQQLGIHAIPTDNNSTVGGFPPIQDRY